MFLLSLDVVFADEEGHIEKEAGRMTHLSFPIDCSFHHSYTILCTFALRFNVSMNTFYPRYHIFT